MRNIDQRAITDGKLDPRDIVMSKPFHGTRLFQVIRLLPEFGGSVLRTLNEQAEERLIQHVEVTKLVAQEPGNTSNEKPLRGKKVLVADDGNVMRKLAVAHLSNLGATIHLCENGQEAVESFRRGLSEQRQRGAYDVRPYDYILMDCEMPIMDGYEAARLIREEEKHYGVRTPIIALTAHSSASEVEKIFKAGMDFHMRKPMNAVCLMKAINQIDSR
ncbi:histidine kinase CKI1-like [Eucalyptus grandis]|nr:histidine kinase CKI1-like [Eucalyptus grandis]